MAHEAYQSWGRQQENERINSHLPLVYSLASNLAPRAKVSGLEIGDLIHTGVLGLYTALASFQEGRGSTFGAYAKPFVRGAMLDEISRHNNESRAVRDKYRKLRDTEDKLVRLLMREPTDKELADAVGIEVKTLSAWLIDIGLRDNTSLEDLAERGALDDRDNTSFWQPELHFLEQEMHERLVAALKKLKLREQQLLHLYYHEELTLREIGYVLELSESQVSRIHKRLLVTLQGALSEAE
ncbi:sigma-70 family RNA polymerase sigma factor [Alicyclobacillus fastidiosus]|uniref:RNA polymerase sigma factor n=1 Tax=Alicyclobacillus fastidiosus TaxID=392011 RepID=A0ABY6ZNU7_9BACL|nr:sigma-70 family RNA polymerase sigma factor [Alicyclobacillus fastidiosus]WAH44502.1 sigma-70 family RNA polymerase sigma factor [Alicyclobacillus fastidiosus]